MHAEENKDIEYSHPAAERFREEGKLFLVDYSKACAAEVLLSILREASAPSFLMVAETVASAADYAERLGSVLGKITLITSYEDFVKAVGFNPTEYARAADAAKKLSANHKNVVISVTDGNGQPLLHKKLCTSGVACGSFMGKYDPVYCISDMLGEGGYAFVAVDAVYSAFSLFEDEEEKTPGSFDLVPFLGKTYYSDIEHSYKRLENLVCAAQKRVIISEVAFRDDAVNLYAALHLINSDFSLLRLRREMQSSRFQEHCDNISSAFSYFCSDEGYLSECMQRLRDWGGYVPRDLQSMDSYFSKALSFMSEEEKVLRCAASSKKIHFRGSEPSLDTIMDRLAESQEDMTQCIFDIFFSEKSKECIEGSVSNSLACKLTGAEFHALFNVLLEFGGVYHYLTGKDSQAKVLRFMRDDSGFEHFVRRRSKVLKTDEFSYSILGRSDIGVYKCAEIVRLVETGALSFPALVLVESDAQLVADRLTASLDAEAASVICGLPPSEGKSKKEKTLAVCDMEAFRTAARDLKISSAIFYHVIHDVFKIRRFVNKALHYGAKEVMIMADYGNLGGHMMDLWQSVLFDGSVYFPFENASITMKENMQEDYRVALERIEAEYCLLATIVRGGQYEDTDAFAKRFGKLLLDYTLYTPEESMLVDLEYLAKVGYHFEAIFENTATIGDKGDKVIRQKLYYERTGEGKTVQTETLSETLEKETIFFNACAKRLCSGCDFLKENCADCPDAKLFIHNSVGALAEHMKSFFEKTLQYDAKVDADRQKKDLQRTISSDDTDEEGADVLDSPQIKEWSDDAIKALTEIQQQNDAANGGVFVCDYAYAKSIREAVYKTYRNMLRKYYITLRDLFNSSTEKAIAACRASLEQTAAAQDDK